MNILNIHTRLNEIAKSARIGASALAQDPANRTQLDTSLAVILAHLQAIHAELKSPDAEQNAARVRSALEQNANDLGVEFDPERNSFSSGRGGW